MKQKKVWRYYCDFCRKSGCSGGHIKKHEKHCVCNPSRECRLCKTEHRDYPAIVKQWLGPVGGCGDIKWLRETMDGCPICILSAIRQVPHELLCGDRGGWWEDFNYQAEMAEWWNEKNNARADEDLEYNRVAFGL